MHLLSFFDFSITYHRLQRCNDRFPSDGYQYNKLNVLSAEVGYAWNWLIISTLICFCHKAKMNELDMLDFYIYVVHEIILTSKARSYKQQLVYIAFPTITFVFQQWENTH